MADTEQFDHRIEPDRAFCDARAPLAIAQIALDIEVREQPRILEHIAGPAPLHRHVDAALGIEEGLVADHDPPSVRPHHAGHRLDDGGLAGPGAPEQRSDADLRRGEIYAQREAWPGEANIDRDHARPSMMRMRLSTRLAISSAASARMMETTVSLSAMASPSVMWVAL